MGFLPFFNFSNLIKAFKIYQNLAKVLRVYAILENFLVIAATFYLQLLKDTL